jgi:hypothetical protein
MPFLAAYFMFGIASSLPQCRVALLLLPLLLLLLLLATAVGAAALQGWSGCWGPRHLC